MSRVRTLEVGDTTLVLDHIALVELVKPYRVVQYLPSHGWRLNVTTIGGVNLCVATGPNYRSGDWAADDDPLEQADYDYLHGIYETICRAIDQEPT